MVCVYRADIHLRVSLCELSQDMVNSAALWFIQQSHHLAYPHNKHPTWNLPTLTIEKMNIHKCNRYIQILKLLKTSGTLNQQKQQFEIQREYKLTVIAYRVHVYCNFAAFQNFLGLQFTFSTKVERISGYISTNCSNRGNLCLASMESSFIAFNRQIVIVSGKFF